MPEFYAFTPACQNTGVAGSSGGVCLTADDRCPAVDETRYLIFEGPSPTKLTLVPGATVCFGPGDLVPVGVVEREVANEVRRYVHLPPAVIHTAPRGRTLVNLPTVFWVTERTPGPLTVTIDGASVTIRVRPVDFRWDFGDGQAASSGAGRPYTPAVDPAVDPAHYLTHVYRQTSELSHVTLTVFWGPTYTIEGVGGQFTTEQVSRVSAGAVQVLQAQAVLTGNS